MGGQQLGHGARVLAGDQLLFRPQVRDMHSNAAAAPRGVLTVQLTSPAGEVEELTPILGQPRGGQACYDVVRHEPKTAGEYRVRFALDGVEMGGSPLAFEVVAGAPDASRSQCILPVGAGALT